MMPPRARAGTLRFLIADDHGIVRHGLRELIMDAFHPDTVVEADRGRRVIDEVRAQAWDLVVLDIGLPDMDGLEVLKAVKQDRNLQVIPVIMLSSSVEGKDIKQAYELGADSYIAKPVSINGLFRAIEMLKNYWFEIVVLRKPMTLIE